jgi:hypothetical protein
MASPTFWGRRKEVDVRYFAYRPGDEGGPSYIRAEVVVSDEESTWAAELPPGIRTPEPVDLWRGEGAFTREQLMTSEEGRQALDAWAAGDDSTYAARDRLAEVSGYTEELLVLAGCGCSWSAKALAANDEDEIIRLGRSHEGTCSYAACGGQAKADGIAAV